VTKINPGGTALVYSTLLGGTAIDAAVGIAVDGTGSAYVTGNTNSADFPTTPGAFQGALLDNDTFVTKLNAAGSALVYSTYLGGSNSDYAEGIAVDGFGNAYLTGYTSSANFPTAHPVQAVNHGGLDAYVTKLNPGGTALVDSTYLGGSRDDYVSAIAVDGAGNAFVVGLTDSVADFPTLHPWQASARGRSDAFIAKINSSATHFLVSAPADTVPAGAALPLTVTPLFDDNTVDTTYRGTVHFTNSDGSATLPADYTFTDADNGPMPSP
jgi:hypothetical protein